jgi:hypothetical protein
MKYANAILLLALVVSTATVQAGDPKYTGDVVGRKLSLIKLEGHVGLWTGSKVLEMDGKKMVETSLSAFKVAGGKSKNGYYGAKGKGKQNRSAIISAAKNQKKYNPKYTALAEYYIGGSFKGKKFDTKKRKWVAVTKTLPGKFRCDTLVNYAYKYGSVGFIRPMTEQVNTDWISATEYYQRIKGYTSIRQSITPNLLYKSLPDSR